MGLGVYEGFSRFRRDFLNAFPYKVLDPTSQSFALLSENALLHACAKTY